MDALEKSSWPGSTDPKIILMTLLAAPSAATSAQNSAEELNRDGFEALQTQRREARLQELIDREDIRELTTRYAHRTAHGISIADLFTEDGSLIVRLPGQSVSERRGRDALTAFSAGRTPNSALAMMHNHLIKIDGDQAIGLCSNEVRVTDNGKSMIGVGYFQDQFRRVSGQWKFLVREITYSHWLTIQES